MARNAIVDHQRVAAKHRVVDGEGLEDQPLEVNDDDAPLEQKLAA